MKSLVFFGTLLTASLSAVILNRVVVVVARPTLHFLIATASAETTLTAKQQISSTLETLVSIVEQNVGEEASATRRQKLRNAINPYFDFAEMSKRSLAKHWLEMDVDQKKDFVGAFSNLLARTYIDKIELIRRGMVEIVSNKDFPPTTSGVARASVKTMVTHKGETFPIEYRLYQKRDEDWKVYDVIVENIGLVSNYRTEFSSVIRKKGISGLITDIKAKQ